MTTETLLRSWLVCFSFVTRETKKTITGDARYMAVTEEEARRYFDQEWGYMQPEIQHVEVDEQ